MLYALTIIYLFIYSIILLFIFIIKFLASLMKKYFPKRMSGAPLHTLSK